MTDTSTDLNYGPLTALIGTWAGDKGMDIAPEPDGEEHNPYHETILFEAIGDVTNAESQRLVALRYHQVVRRNSNNKVFHNETGYWIWDAERNLVMQTLTIPRGVSLVAGGSATADATQLEVSAASDDPDWGISQAPFMRDNAKTVSFRHAVSVQGETLHYDETTVVDIYGNRFEHTDRNELHRVK